MKYIINRIFYRNKALKIMLKTTTIRAIKITRALSLICLYHGLGKIRHSRKIRSPTTRCLYPDRTYAVPSLFTATDCVDSIIILPQNRRLLPIYFYQLLSLDDSHRFAEFTALM